MFSKLVYEGQELVDAMWQVKNTDTSSEWEYKFAKGEEKQDVSMFIRQTDVALLLMLKMKEEQAFHIWIIILLNAIMLMDWLQGSCFKTWTVPDKATKDE